MGFQKISFRVFPELRSVSNIQPLIEQYLSLVGYEVGLYDGALCVRSADSSVGEACGEFSYERKTAREIVELALVIASGMRMSDEEKKHHLRRACIAQEELERELRKIKRDISALKGEV